MPRREPKIGKKGIHRLAFEFSRFTSKMGPGDFRTARKNDAEQKRETTFNEQKPKVRENVERAKRPKKELATKNERQSDKSSQSPLDRRKTSLIYWKTSSESKVRLLET